MRAAQSTCTCHLLLSWRDGREGLGGTGNMTERGELGQGGTGGFTLRKLQWEKQGTQSPDQEKIRIH